MKTRLILILTIIISTLSLYSEINQFDTIMLSISDLYFKIHRQSCI